MMRSIQYHSVACLLAAVVSTAACSAPSGTDSDSSDGQGDGDSVAGDGDSVAGDGDSVVGDGDGVVGDGDGIVGDGDGVVGDGDGVVGDGDGVVGDGDGVIPAPDTGLLPARIRRLTNSEYTRAVQDLLGTTMDPGVLFPPDTRQQGYTVNEAQRVDPLLAKQLDSVASELAAEAILNLESFAPCADPTAGGEACATTFGSAFAAKAYRRSLEDGELDALMTLYHGGADEGSYAEGIELMVRGILQTPAFLYLTEIGDGSGSGTVAMTPREMASALSFLLTGGPPDAELLAAADDSTLATQEGRALHARRLLSGSESGKRVLRLVQEWLGLDRISATAKDSNIYPDFEGLRDAMGAETRDFVAEVIGSDGGQVSTFLGADWTVAGAELASMYDAAGQGRVEVPDRRGLLNRGAFLSVYAHAHETGPVLRGTAVMRRVACLDIELPTTLNVEIVPPVPDLEKTTRERFSIHSQDAACQGCHDLIDPVGFSFEHLDGMGTFRSEENQQPVDSATTVVLGSDFDGDYESSNGLALALSQSAEVRECFARQMFRANAGEGTGAKLVEDAFIDSWADLPSGDQGSLIEILVSMASSEFFLMRGEQ